MGHTWRSPEIAQNRQRAARLHGQGRTPAQPLSNEKSGSSHAWEDDLVTAARDAGIDDAAVRYRAALASGKPRQRGDVSPRATK